VLHGGAIICQCHLLIFGDTLAGRFIQNFVFPAEHCELLFDHQCSRLETVFHGILAYVIVTVFVVSLIVSLVGFFAFRLRHGSFVDVHDHGPGQVATAVLGVDSGHVEVGVSGDRYGLCIAGLLEIHWCFAGILVEITIAIVVDRHAVILVDQFRQGRSELA